MLYHKILINVNEYMIKLFVSLNSVNLLNLNHLFIVD